ncbi:MAG: RNA polymerase subunit sigma-24 [Methylocystis sp.]|nr:RNA polymerase subunit sigma-24 [Methylocystis sp.]MBI3274812.1 RNA polymerase subunit sigma-24 [Methylocystis sp.]
MGKSEDFCETLEKLTPGLRRYARALLAGGADEWADTLAQGAIQLALQETRPKETLPCETGEIRICLYAAFTHVAQRKLRGGAPSRLSLRHPVIIHGLADLPLEERETLLLVALEGFSYEEVARITGGDRSLVLMRLMRARAALTALDQRPAAPANAPHRSAGHLRVVK